MSLRKLLALILGCSLFSCGDGKPGMFSANGYHIGKDKVWYKSSMGMNYTIVEIPEADPATFVERKMLSEVSGETRAFGMDKRHVFWGANKIEGADLTTFEFLCSSYSRDKNAVYYTAQVLTKDLAHFEVISRDFVRDANHVYFGNEVFSKDPTHFTRVGDDSSYYFKDSNTCWYFINELEGADPARLQYLGSNTAADAKNVYFEMNKIEGADPNTFKVLEHNYSKDAFQVYLKYMPIEEADPATFKMLSEDYALDKHFCYYGGMVIKEADHSSFEVIDQYYTKDVQRVFMRGSLIEGADPATFRVLNSSAGCSCDARFAYNMNRRIKGVNPASFEAGKNCLSCSDTAVEFD